ncbi:hypothetical protein ACFFSY_09525 [Paenibacillus aurantiacus]|uniref:VCBS repeat-containing protein n=1 Tax=Paenibacillus aurantiacus TaxID=1936118 RepID=A0ABV5KLP7_9BACL
MEVEEKVVMAMMRDRKLPIALLVCALAATTSCGDNLASNDGIQTGSPPARETAVFESRAATEDEIGVARKRIAELDGRAVLEAAADMKNGQYNELALKLDGQKANLAFFNVLTPGYEPRMFFGDFDGDKQEDLAIVVTAKIGEDERVDEIRAFRTNDLKEINIQDASVAADAKLGQEPWYADAAIGKRRIFRLENGTLVGELSVHDKANKLIGSTIVHYASKEGWLQGGEVVVRTLPDRMPLRYAPMQPAAVRYKLVEASQGLETIRSLAELDAGEVILYRAEGQTEGGFVGYRGESDSTITRIGEIENNVYLEEAFAKTVEVFGREHLRVTWPCGSNCQHSDYAIVEKDGEIRPGLAVDYAAFEVDLDGDGRSEIVTGYGSPVPEMRVIREEKGKLSEAFVNETFGASPYHGVLFEANDRTIQTTAIDTWVTYEFDGLGRLKRLK